MVSSLGQADGCQVDYFKARYNVETLPYETVPVSEEDHFNTHRSRFFGSYHDFQKMSSQKVGGDIVLSLGGGCGEVYRGFFSNIFDKKYQDLPGNKASAELAISSFIAASPWLGPDLPSLYTDTLSETIASLDGNTLGDKLEDHYFKFRNRFHFGMAAVTRLSGMPTAWPLISQSLFKLSRWVSPDIRRSGRIIFDVTKELSEVSAHLPYRDAKMDQYYDHYLHRPSKFENASFDFSPKPQLLKDVAVKNLSMRVGEFKEINDPGFIRHTATNLLDEMQSYADTRAFVSDELRKRIDWLISKDKKFQRVWVSKLASFVDICRMQ